MIEFGNTLRAAREARKMTTSEIAAKTHMLVQQIEALEREDFSRIAAPIYGRGFVRLYCEALGIDSRPLIEEFMEIYNGNRELNIRRKPDRQAAPAAAAPRPESGEKSAAPFAIPPEEGGPSAPGEPRPPAEEPAAAESAMPPAAPQAAEDPFMLEQKPAPEPAHRFKRFNPYVQPEKSGNEERRRRMPDIPPYVWRFALLAAAGLVLIWLLFAGIRALYRASMSSPGGGDAAQTQQTGSGDPEEAAPPPQPAAPQPAAQSKSGRTDRTPLEIPPLYID